MNAAHLDNFKSSKPNRVAIFDVTNELDGARWFEIASGKDADEAKERFYSRFMIRSVDQEMISIAQQNNRLFIAKFVPGHALKIIERRATLIA